MTTEFVKRQQALNLRYKAAKIGRPVSDELKFGRPKGKRTVSASKSEEKCPQHYRIKRSKNR